MKDYKVKDFMMKNDELLIVREDANIYEAASILEQARQDRGIVGFHSPALLVADATGRVVAKLSLLNLVAGLEPKYSRVEGPKVTRFGLTTEYLESIYRQYGLWQDSLESICRRAGAILVRDLVTRPEESEVVHEDESLSFAVHQMAAGSQHNLVVENTKGEITGLLRLDDIYSKIHDLLETCRLAGNG